MRGKYLNATTEKECEGVYSILSGQNSVVVPVNVEKA
jgi:hypothetical protein